MTAFDQDCLKGLERIIDLRLFLRDANYRKMVTMGLLNPTWEGISFPFRGIVKWEEIACELGQADNPYASMAEELSRVTKMVGNKCPFIRIPIPGKPGYVYTMKNPGYHRNTVSMELQDHVIADYGLIILRAIEECVRDGRVEESSIILCVKGCEAENITFHEFYFHKTEDPWTYQIDMIFHCDLVPAEEASANILENVRMRVSIHYSVKDGAVSIDNTIYTDRSRERIHGERVDETLLPIFRNDESLEVTAEEFLRIAYPEALGDKPVPVDEDVVAERLGTTVRRADLTDKGENLSGLYYPEGETEMVLDFDGTEYEEQLPDRTILYDYRIESNPRLYSDTIIHECVHDFKDRAFYYLQKLCDHRISCFGYRRETDLSNPALEKAERQVARLVPRVKMPRKNFIRKATELLIERQDNGTWEAYEEVIRELAAFFHVSKEAVRIRLTELGFETARGVSRFVDGRYIPPFTWDAGSISRNQTFTISWEEALREYKNNPAFRKILSSGVFVYVDAHFCLDDPRFIYRDTGGVHMTDEARRQMDKCCLVFDIRYKSTYSRFRNGVFFNANEKNERTAELSKAQKALLASFVSGRKQMAASVKGAVKFGDKLQMLMEAKQVTYEELEYRTGITVRTLMRYRKEGEVKKSLRYMVAICIGLELSPSEAYNLLELGGYKLTDEDEHITLRFIIDNRGGHTVGEINWVLSNSGESPLTPLVTVPENLDNVG